VPGEPAWTPLTAGLLRAQSAQVKKIRLNADYLNNALQGGSTALHALEGHSAFNTLRQSSKELRDRMDKIRA
jgi:hypothetical protein